MTPKEGPLRVAGRLDGLCTDAFDLDINVVVDDRTDHPEDDLGLQRRDVQVLRHQLESDLAALASDGVRECRREAGDPDEPELPRGTVSIIDPADGEVSITDPADTEAEL